MYAKLKLLSMLNPSHTMLNIYLWQTHLFRREKHHQHHHCLLSQVKGLLEEMKYGNAKIYENDLLHLVATVLPTSHKFDRRGIKF